MGEQRNVAHASITMLENHYHWVDTWWRTKNPDAMLQGYKIDLQNFVGSKLPASILKLVYRFTYKRRGMKKVRATGIGVHTPEEIIQMGKDDLQVLTDMLGDKPFFFGEEPTTLDVVAFSSIAQLVAIEKEEKKEEEKKEEDKEKVEDEKEKEKEVEEKSTT